MKLFRVGVLLLAMLQGTDGRKHRYGRVAGKVASRSRDAVMVTAPPETHIDGMTLNGRRRDAELTEYSVSEESLDGNTLQAVQRSLQRARRRSPEEINPEPYVMLAGLWLTTQVFS